METVYRIGSDDTLRSVTGGWDDFARENQAEELAGDALLGQPIWKFLGNQEVQHLFEILFSRVREEGREITIPFRCDAPAVRRWQTLTFQPVPDEEAAIEVTVRTLAEERRTPVRLLQPGTPRSEETLVLCAWCKRARLGEDEWSEVEEAVDRYELFGQAELPAISHGICPDCKERVESEALSA